MNINTDFEKALLAISEIYISIYEIDIKEDKQVAIKSNDLIEELAASFESAQDKLYEIQRDDINEKH